MFLFLNNLKEVSVYISSSINDKKSCNKSGMIIFYTVDVLDKRNEDSLDSVRNLGSYSVSEFETFDSRSV